MNIDREELIDQIIEVFDCEDTAIPGAHGEA